VSGDYGTPHPDAFVFGPPATVEKVVPTIEQARRERDDALDRVDRGADEEWKDYAWSWAYAYLRSHREWFPDDSWAEGLVEPREARAFGPVVLRLLRAGFMARTGEMRQRTRGHAALGPVWRSTIYTGERFDPPPAPAR